MTSRLTVLLALLLPLAFFAGCAEETASDEEATQASVAETQEAFFERLLALCGQAFEGEGVEAPEGDDTFDAPLVMHVRECYDDEVRIPLHVGEDRSRTWVITRTAGGLRLKHDHRHEDGAEDEVTNYGGDTEEAGTSGRQDFHADRETAEMLPEAATNVWTIEVDGEQFVYALDRVGTDRQFRIEFDLTEPVEAPPAPWGYEDVEPTHPPGGE